MADAFRKNVSGSKDGLPDWAKDIALGNDAGLFKVDGAVWKVHGNLGTLVGGVRALLLQAAHPAPLAGVAQHSRYETDPMGRLAGTTRWLTITTFGSKEIIEREAKRVNAMHSKVSGDYKNKLGVHSNYRAQDSRFLLWVHCAFTDSFIKSHLALGYPLPDGPDEYVREWANSAVPLGLTAAPKSIAELEATLKDFRANDLGRTEKTLDVVRFILKPPFGGTGLLFYKIIANAAIATLDSNELEILGLKTKSKIWLKICRGALNVFRAILGPESPSQRLARERIARIS
ncbi:MAG: oxygenase MpaB family protein [Candidatus Nanopelagicaceae bacterium]